MKEATQREPSAHSKPMRAYQSPALSPEERERLILEHLPQVRFIARRIHDRLPESVSLDHLISTGIVGLISADDQFDATQHGQQETYPQDKLPGSNLC